MKYRWATKNNSRIGAAIIVAIAIIRCHCGASREREAPKNWSQSTMGYFSSVLR